MDFTLTEQEKMLQSLAKDFAHKEVAPRAATIDRTNEVPLDIVKKMGKLGFHRPYIIGT
jgi:alkylation response protein AidB-like acyl-CoA dehydrogenase